MQVRVALAALAGLLAAGCATVSDVVMAPVAPQPTEITRGVLTARTGDLVHVQDARVLAAARLDAPATVSVLGDLFDTQTELPAGATLYRVLLRGRPNEAVYCADSVVNNDVNQDIRVCLADADNDGRFDQAWEMSEPGQSVSIGGGDVWANDPKFDPPIPYSEVEPDAIAPMQIGIVFRCALLASNCWFNVVEVDGGGVRDLGFVNFPFPRAENRPAVVDVMGARIRVISNDLTQMEYEVIGPFPTRTPIAIVRYMPRTTYIYY